MSFLFREPSMKSNAMPDQNEEAQQKFSLYVRSYEFREQTHYCSPSAEIRKRETH
jgi:hypothetical protein